MKRELCYLAVKFKKLVYPDCLQVNLVYCFWMNRHRRLILSQSMK